MSAPPAPHPARIQRLLVIRGRVQGVGFRWATLTEARRLHIDGWVRNRADGSVETLLDGPDMAVQQMMRWCWHGPAEARVDSIDVSLPTQETDPATHRFEQRPTV
jgi:acylphosphatase